VSKKKILWLIAARKGSKSVPNKNIKKLGDHPLIGYRIKATSKSIFSNDIWISTDSIEYAKIAKEYGTEVPFIRPDYLATDDASSIDVVIHAMDFANKNNLLYDYIGLLEPTSPFILSNQLDQAIQLLENNESATAVVSTRESRPNRIFIQEESTFLSEIASNIKNLKKMGRQAFNIEITPSGGFYISRWGDFIEKKTFYTEKTLGFLVDDISGLEIDEPIDWQFAEFIVEKKLINIELIF
jgi:N-acylneuraminate cytidylyltransferase/CMP-N,N'-diacetyllegionaminic acid synthase